MHFRQKDEGRAERKKGLKKVLEAALQHFDLHPFGQNMLPMVTKDARECAHYSVCPVPSLTAGVTSH